MTNKDPLSFKKFVQTINWAIKWTFSTSPWGSVFEILLQIAQNLIPIYMSYVFSRIFATITTVLSSGTGYEVAIRQLFPFLGMLFLSALLSNLIAISYIYLSFKLSVTRRTRLEKDFIYKMTQIDIQQFEDKKIMDIIKRAEDHIWKIEGIYRDIIKYIGQLVKGISSLFIIISFLPILIPIALILSLVVVIKDILVNRDLRTLDEKNTEKWRQYWTGRWNLTEKGALNELKIQNGTDKLHSQIYRIREERNKESISTYFKYFKLDLLGRFDALYEPLSILLIVLRAIALKGDIGTVTFYSDRSFDINRFFSILVRDAVYLYDQTKYIEAVKRFFDIEPVIINGKKKLKTKLPPRLEFENVSFKYPGSSNFALRNINLVIMPGDEIAFVGENGAGKSTLIKLLLRIHDPIKGRILVNGIDLKELDLPTYYERIGALFQDYYFRGYETFKEIIEFPKTKFSTKTYIEAAKLADVHDTISKMSKGYKQKANAYFDDGVELSFGQQQKLVIARVFYRNAPILILDEPTASIDAVAEAKIFNRIYKFTEDKTVIIISHRFSTVRNAQKIYVLDKGVIIESGSHKELMEVKGMYEKAFNVQAKGYGA